jgi:glycosyltransferase involved in cell wall biosynthesis
VDKRKQTEVGARYGVQVQFSGVVPRERIPAIDRSAHLYFSAEVNPPCPNAVIEALACGTPVLGFDTGALAELVGPGAGQVVPYGGSPWELDAPDLDALAEAARAILLNQASFREAARRHAETHFGLDAMVEAYLGFLLQVKEGV